jgi:hypothetical protein
VIANFMSLGEQTGDKSRIGLCPIAYNKEASTRAVLRQKIGKGGCGLKARPIVKGQDNGFLGSAERDQVPGLPSPEQQRRQKPNSENNQR